jgi:hypothetical protein
VSANKKALISRVAPEITVRPRECSADAAVDPDDAYASLAPEELGEHALRSATQSGWPAAHSDAYSLGAAPASAAPVFPETSVSSKELWAATLELAVEYSAWVESRRGDGDAGWDDVFEATWSRDIDLNQAKVVEASLFDAGSEETMYETRAPRIFADNDSTEHTVGNRRRRAAGA